MSLFLIIFTCITEAGSVFVWYIINLTLLGNYPKTSHALLGICLIVPIIAIISFGVSWTQYNTVLSYTYTGSIWWLGLLLYMTLASICVGLLYSIFLYSNITTVPFTIIALIIFSIALATTIYGTIHANHTYIKEYTISKESFPTSWNNKKIVLISDTHIGQVHGKKFLKKTIEKVNEQNPDIVFIAGDLVDGPKIPIDWLDELKNIKSTHGVYFTSGNHETYSREFKEIMQKLDTTVHVLEDTYVTIDGVQIGGISYKHETTDATRKTLNSLNLNQQIPSIIMLHDPKNIQALIDNNVTLTLSGHTHGGQLFPGNLMVKKIYGIYGYGINKTQNTYSITTSGVGTAQSPIRVGTQSEIVSIKIQ